MQIKAVKIEEVENVENETIRPVVAEIGLQGGKAGGASSCFDHQLAIDQRRANWQALKCANDFFAELLRPVEAVASEQLDPAGLDPYLQSIAVKLYLVNPAFA